MFSEMFNKLWALFNSFRGTGSNESKIHCFERFSKPPSHKQGGDQLTIITKTIRIVCTVWLMKIKNCPTSIKFLLQSTLCGVGLPVGGCCWDFCWEGKWCLQPSSSVVTGVSWSEKERIQKRCELLLHDSTQNRNCSLSVSERHLQGSKLLLNSWRLETETNGVHLSFQFYSWQEAAATGDRKWIYLCSHWSQESSRGLLWARFKCKAIGLPLFRPLQETVVLSIINHTCGISSESPGYKNIKYHDPRYEIQKCPKSDVLTLPHGVGVFSSSKSDHTCGIFFGKPCVQATFSNLKQLLGNVDNFGQPMANFSTFFSSSNFGILRQLVTTCSTFWQCLAT